MRAPASSRGGEGVGERGIEGSEEGAWKRHLERGPTRRDNRSGVTWLPRLRQCAGPRFCPGPQTRSGRRLLKIQGQGLTEGKCGALQRSFAAAVYQSREQSAAAEETEEAAATRMQKNIMAVPDHFYNKNNHEKCGDKCPAKSTNKEIFNAAHVPHATGKYLDPGQGDRYYNHVVSVFKTYSSPDIARKLTLACTTNTVECGSSLLWLFHLPKARFRPKTGERHLQDAVLHKAMGNTAGLQAGAAGLGISQLSERNQAYALQMDEQSRR